MFLTPYLKLMRYYLGIIWSQACDIGIILGLVHISLSTARNLQQRAKSDRSLASTMDELLETIG